MSLVIVARPHRSNAILFAVRVKAQAACAARKEDTGTPSFECSVPVSVEDFLQYYY